MGLLLGRVPVAVGVFMGVTKDCSSSDVASVDDCELFVVASVEEFSLVSEVDERV